jgi:hypothetical protein
MKAHDQQDNPNEWNNVGSVYYVDKSQRLNDRG